MTELTCIVCPMGCRLSVSGAAPDFRISGQNCPRGEAYARNELTEPRRMVTAVIQLTGSHRMLPVKTERPIPKEKIGAALAEIKTATIRPPIRIGQIIRPDIAGTGIALIATKNITI